MIMFAETIGAIIRTKKLVKIFLSSYNIFLQFICYLCGLKELSIL